MSAGADIIPLTFPCRGDALVGVLHMPAVPRPRGVIIVPGAPQYRAGSHRQFVLLARDLAAAGIPVLRFDYRGIGDSDGDFIGFEGIDEDIAAAIEALSGRVPSVREVVLLGLCDGASAVAFQGARNPRVGGLILINPWVRSEETVAEARVRHYYAQRLLAGEFWHKLLSGKLNLAATLGGFLGDLRAARGGGNGRRREVDDAGELPDRVGSAVADYAGPVLVVLSGADLTAQEFDRAVLRSPMRGAWAARANVTVHRLDGANHTYSAAAWRSQVHAWILVWLAVPI